MGTSIGNIEAVESNGQLGVKSSGSLFAAPFYFQDFYDEAAVKRFTKNVERLVRTSKEYDGYIGLLRANLTQLNHDNLMHNITTTDASLEFHHYPFTLFDIVSIVMNKNILDTKPFTSFSLAKEIMELHYRNIIGLVPLSITTHELAHDGQIFISTKQIFGNYNKFIDEFRPAIPNELLMNVKDIEEKTRLGVPSDFGGIL